jgi:Zn-dependent peptidase ImmA (M78 family)
MVPPGPIENLTTLAERAGIIVVWCDFGAAIDGVTMKTDDLPPCIFLNRTAPADRLRASLAHEIGHTIMHRVPTDTMEDEAYTFGAELLVPERELRKDLIGGRRVLVQFTMAHGPRLRLVNRQSRLYSAVNSLSVIG